MDICQHDSHNIALRGGAVVEATDTYRVTAVHQSERVSRTEAHRFKMPHVCRVATVTSRRVANGLTGAQVSCLNAQAVVVNVAGHRDHGSFHVCPPVSRRLRFARRDGVFGVAALIDIEPYWPDAPYVLPGRSVSKCDVDVEGLRVRPHVHDVYERVPPIPPVHAVAIACGKRDGGPFV